MAYEELKAQIREYIKPNEQEEITGAIMQAILLEMVNQLGVEGSYLPLTGGNVTGGIVVSSDLSSPSHEALRLNQSGISVEKIASVGLNEILNVTANTITYSSYYPSTNPNTLTIALGYTGVTLSGGVTAASFINSSVDASIRYQYLLKADGNVISISDIGGTDMQTVWEALAASTNEQINVSHLSTALNGYIHPTLSNLSNGDVLVYDSVGTWVNTSMSSFLSGYATETWVNTQLASYATQSWVSTNYLNKVSTNSGDIYINDGGSAWVLANLNTLIVGYGYITASALNGYATEAWVGQQGYLTSSALNGYIHPTITNLSNGDILIYDSVGTWVNTPLSSFGFATETWVGQQGYITSAALNGYATQSWVTSQGYIQPTLSNLANGDVLIYDSVGTWVNTNLNTTISGFGYITSSALNGYATQSWVGQQGYITSSGSCASLINKYISAQNDGVPSYDRFKTFRTSSSDTGFGDGYIMSFAWNIGYYCTQLFLDVDDTYGFSIRYRNSSGTWAEWKKIITEANIGSQSVNYATSAGSASYANGISMSATNGDILINDGGSSWVATNLNSAISGFGYITSSALSGYATISDLANYLYCFGGTDAQADTNFGYYVGMTVHSGITSNWWHILSMSWGRGADISNSYWMSQLALPTEDRRGVYYRKGGSYINQWYRLCDADGTGASGTWGINITGSAGSVEWTNVTNRPTNVSAFTNDSGYITSSGSCAYATSAGSANILGHSVTLNSAHSLSNGDILVYDSVGSWTNVSSGLSDIRQKDVINYNAEPLFETVANAPAIKFTYKDNTYSFRRGIHVGSIAQYWQTTLPETVSMDNDGILSMQYDVIALLSTISVAKKVSEHERRIILLERENEQLKKEIQALKSA